MNQQRTELIKYLNDLQVRASGSESSAFSLLQESQKSLDVLDYDNAIKQFENVINQFIDLNRSQLVATLFNARNSLIKQKYKGLRVNYQINSKLSKLLQDVSGFVSKTDKPANDNALKEVLPTLFNSLGMLVSGSISDGLNMLKGIEKNIGGMDNDKKSKFQAIIKDANEIDQIYIQLNEENKMLKDSFRKQAFNSFIVYLEQISKYSGTETAKIQQLSAFQNR